MNNVTPFPPLIGQTNPARIARLLHGMRHPKSTIRNACANLLLRQGDGGARAEAQKFLAGLDDHPAQLDVI